LITNDIDQEVHERVEEERGRRKEEMKLEKKSWKGKDFQVSMEQGSLFIGTKLTWEEQSFWCMAFLFSVAIFSLSWPSGSCGRSSKKR